MSFFFGFQFQSPVKSKKEITVSTILWRCCKSCWTGRVVHINQRELSEKHRRTETLSQTGRI